MQSKTMLLFMVMMSLLGACDFSAEVSPTATPALPPELILYDWAADIPSSVLEDFTTQTGIPIRYETYGSVGESLETLRQKPAYDVVVLDNEIVFTLRPEKLLHPLQHQQLPNLANLDPAFRDLYYDPNNAYCIPFNWGTTGLLVRTDVVAELPQTWADLWSGEYRLGLVSDARTMLGIALHSLGYSVNSTDETELQAAQAHLAELAPRVVYIASDDDAEIAERMVAGEADIAIAWTGSAQLALQAQADRLTYILPTDGTMLWGDNFCLAAETRYPEAAHTFLNYLLKPEVAAEIALFNGYPTANLEARALLGEVNTIMYPPKTALENAVIYKALPPEIDELYQTLVKEAIGEGTP